MFDDCDALLTERQPGGRAATGPRPSPGGDAVRARGGQAPRARQEHGSHFPARRGVVVRVLASGQGVPGEHRAPPAGGAGHRRIGGEGYIDLLASARGTAVARAALVSSCVCNTMSCPTGCCAGDVCQTPSFSTCRHSGTFCVACPATTCDSCSGASCNCGTAAPRPERPVHRRRAVCERHLLVNRGGRDDPADVLGWAAETRGPN